MQGCTRKIIGKGKVSIIYSNGHKAYKTYPPSYHSSWIKHEFMIQQELFEKTTLPILKYELHEREIEMDIIEGITLADRVRKQKYPNGLNDLIDLQVGIYEYHSLNLGDAFVDFNIIIQNSAMGEELKEKALYSLSLIEKRKSLCHFDFHFENIMFDGRNYYIIDWVNAKLGNPVMDIARTYIILKQYATRIAEKYIATITKKMKLSDKDVRVAIPLMAALRLIESNSVSFRETLIGMIQRDYSM